MFVAVAAPGAAELGAGTGPAGAALWGSRLIRLAALSELLSALWTDARRKESTISGSRGRIPSWLLSNLPPKRRISLKAGLSCCCCVSLCIAAHRTASNPLQRCGCCCRCGCEPWSSAWLQGRGSWCGPQLGGSLGLSSSMTRGLHLETASPGAQRDPSRF